MARCLLRAGRRSVSRRLPAAPECGLRRRGAIAPRPPRFGPRLPPWSRCPPASPSRGASDQALPAGCTGVHRLRCPPTPAARTGRSASRAAWKAVTINSNRGPTQTGHRQHRRHRTAVGSITPIPHRLVQRQQPQRRWPRQSAQCCSSDSPTTPGHRWAPDPVPSARALAVAIADGYYRRGRAVPSDATFQLTQPGSQIYTYRTVWSTPAAWRGCASSVSGSTACAWRTLCRGRVHGPAWSAATSSIPAGDWVMLQPRVPDNATAWPVAAIRLALFGARHDRRRDAVCRQRHLARQHAHRRQPDQHRSRRRPGLPAWPASQCRRPRHALAVWTVPDNAPVAQCPGFGAAEPAPSRQPGRPIASGSIRPSCAAAYGHRAVVRGQELRRSDLSAGAGQRPPVPEHAVRRFRDRPTHHGCSRRSPVTGHPRRPRPHLAAAIRRFTLGDQRASPTRAVPAAAACAP